MPLTSSGRKIISQMESPPSQGGYGKKKGKSVFYAMIQMHKKGTEKWHGKGKSKNMLMEKLSKKYSEEIK